MQFQLPIQIKSPEKQISYRDKILLVGSCFTEHIGNSLGELKFSTLQNPNGILFDPRSVCSSLTSYIENKKYKKEDLFYLNEVWRLNKDNKFDLMYQYDSKPSTPPTAMKK